MLIMLALDKIAQLSGRVDWMAKEMREIKELDKIGLMLYWCEGSKTERLRLTNSDAGIIKYWIKFLREDLEISKDRIYGMIEIHEGEDVEKAQKYWEEQTGITNWWNTRIRPLGKYGKGKKKGKLPYGIVQVTVLHSSTEFKDVMKAISLHFS